MMQWITVICCHKILNNNIYFLFENTYCKTVIDDLSTADDSMTVSNCHRFYLGQKIIVIVERFCCRYIT